ncbi:hypothetical protein [Halostella sp. PRR32]|uniref:hypothetical protein n=1 Tax=Halostella sp. PRR32 TaxID=3098147 RepID=UPI002B1D2423|nr:hypothetical protein [Halostella sp. PRR32]
MGTSGTSPVDWNALPEFTLENDPDADRSDAPDHVRAAAYSNRLFDASFEAGDSGKYVYLADVEESFFDEMEAERDLEPVDETYASFRDDPDVIALERFEQLPDEFAVDVERTREAAHGDGSSDARSS